MGILGIVVGVTGPMRVNQRHNVLDLESLHLLSLTVAQHLFWLLLLLSRLLHMRGL